MLHLFITLEPLSKETKMSDSAADLRAEIEKLRAENAGLKKSKQRGLTFKVSAKGAVSVYGMGRFPVTLYKEQWDALLAKKEELEAFIAENIDSLKMRETA
jgi:hypothetical protein